MKKIVSLILCIFILLGLSSCNKEEKPEEPKPNTHEHTYEVDWSYDDTTHFHKATCEHINEKKDVESHKFGDWVVTTEPTDQKDGIRKRICSICKYEDTDSVKYNGTALGKSIDVVSASSYTDFRNGVSVLDSTNDLNIIKISGIKTTENYSKSTNSMYEMIMDNSVSFSLGVGAEASIGGFYVDISNDFSTKNSISYKDNLNQYFYVNTIKANREIYYINNYSTEATFENLFSNDYLKALDQLMISQDFENFFKKYGTHLIASAIYGGKIDFYYSIASNSHEINSSNNIKIQSTIEAGIRGVTSASTSISNEITNALGIGNQEVQTFLYAKSAGGKIFTCTDLSDYKKNLDSWTKSIEEDSSNNVLINYSQDGLIPLWSILPVKYKNLSDKMEDAFVKYYNNGLDKVIEGFAPKKINEDTVNFAGGNGSKEFPYLIKTYQHLSHIKGKDAKGVYFKLIDHIDLNGITFSPFEKFYGELDGNNYSIKNWVMPTITQKEPTNLMYFGLFKQNYGCIKNLKLTYDKDITAIQYTYKGVSYFKPNNWWRYIGGLVSYNAKEGKVLNCEVDCIHIQFDQEFKDLGNNLGVYAGALVGANYGTITYAAAKNCNMNIFNGADYQDGGSTVSINAGGILGRNSGTVKYAYSYGNEIEANTRGGYHSAFYHYVVNEIGGIVGFNEAEAKIEYSLVYDNTLIQTQKNYSGYPVVTMRKGRLCAGNYGNINHFFTLTNQSDNVIGFTEKADGYSNHISKDFIDDISLCEGYEDFKIQNRHITFLNLLV